MRKFLESKGITPGDASYGIGIINLSNGRKYNESNATKKKTKPIAMNKNKDSDAIGSAIDNVKNRRRLGQNLLPSAFSIIMK